MLLFFRCGAVCWSLVRFWAVKNLAELADGPTLCMNVARVGYLFYLPICHCDSLLALWLNVLLARN